MENRLNIGDVVKHFKRSILPSCDLQRNPNLGLYKILNIGSINSETGEKMVTYMALYYDNIKNIYFDIFERPMDMFLSEVDHNKYPDIVQKYRFEKVDPNHDFRYF